MLIESVLFDIFTASWKEDVVIIHAYVGWVDRNGVPRVYVTHDPVEADQGLVHVSIKTVTAGAGTKRAEAAVLAKWERYRHLCMPVK